MKRQQLSCLILFLILWSISQRTVAQEEHKTKSIFRDTLDGAFDVSRFLIEVNGFIAIPFLITEPAFGGFGGGLGLVFLNKRAPLIDTVRGTVKISPVPPTITGGGGFYSANHSWAGIAFRSGMFRKPRLRYRLVAGYADLNLAMYKTDKNGKERGADFNFKTIPISGYLLKQFKGTSWSAGLNYMFLHTEVAANSSTLPEYVEDKELKSIVSIPGVTVEFDNRDNIFTPNTGLRVHASYGFSDDAFGSDYTYQNLNAFVLAYRPLSKKLTGALRYEMQQVFNDAPFYLLPYINLRGLPTARYQGNVTSVVETEVRWDFVPRWSIVGFVGSGKAYDTWNEFNDASWRTSGGGGFRYLMARQFKLRAGIDLARGPEQWAYYIVFGSAWLR